jgi:hypothetical protein
MELIKGILNWYPRLIGGMSRFIEEDGILLLLFGDKDHFLFEVDVGEAAAAFPLRTGDDECALD